MINTRSLGVFKPEIRSHRSEVSGSQARTLRRELPSCEDASEAGEAGDSVLAKPSGQRTEIRSQKSQVVFYLVTRHLRAKP